MYPYIWGFCDTLYLRAGVAIQTFNSLPISNVWLLNFLLQPNKKLLVYILTVFIYIDLQMNLKCRIQISHPTLKYSSILVSRLFSVQRFLKSYMKYTKGTYLSLGDACRYNFERFSNDLPRTKRLLNFRDPVLEGYFPKLDSLVSSRVWRGRPPNAKLSVSYQQIVLFYLVQLE